MRHLLRSGLFMVILLVAVGAAAQEAPTADELRLRFEDATDALDAGDLERARRLYLEVWEHQQTYDVATNLTAIEFRLGNYAAAAEFARAALARFPPSEDPTARDGLESLYDQARAEVGTATVTAPEGAEVRLDGRRLGTAPLEEVFVAPGTHRFSATLGTSEVGEEVTVGKGSAFAVEFDFSQLAAQPPEPTVPPPPPPRATPEPAGDASGAEEKRRKSALRAVAIISGSVLTAGSLGAHIGFRVRAGQFEDEAEQAWTAAEWSTGDGGCAGSSHPACEELVDKWERRDRAGLWANITLGATAAFGAATVAAIVWPRPKREQTGLTVTPWGGPEASGLVLEGKFR